MRAWWTTLSVGVALCLAPLVAHGYCLNVPQGINKPVDWKTIPVTYQVSDNLTDAAMLKAIDDAFATWEAVKCSTMKFTKGSQFKICTESDKTKCATGTVHFDAFTNGYIYIFWYDSSNSTAFPVGDTNAYYTFINYDMPDTIKGGAIAVNAFKYNWNATGGDKTSPGIIDLQNEATTMVGSMIGLSDATIAAASMYPNLKFGDTAKRSLHQDDIDGITYLYFDKADTTCTLPPAPGADGCSGTAPAPDGGTPTGDGTVPTGDGTVPTGDGAPPAGDGTIYTESGMPLTDSGSGKQCTSSAQCAEDEICSAEGICVKVGGGDDDGCGCRLDRQASRSLPLMLLIIGIPLILLRRRRR